MSDSTEVRRFGEDWLCDNCAAEFDLAWCQGEDNVAFCYECFAQDDDTVAFWLRYNGTTVNEEYKLAAKLKRSLDE